MYDGWIEHTLCIIKLYYPPYSRDKKAHAKLSYLHANLGLPQLAAPYNLDNCVGHNAYGQHFAHFFYVSYNDNKEAI